jgi:hypothetical protein
LSGLSHLNLRRTRIASCLLVAVLGLVVLAPAGASAAGPPAAVDQYTGPTGPTGGTGPQGGQGAAGNAGAAGENAAAGGGGGGGKLPFTGYPLTTLLVIMAALMATGLIIRTGVAANDRLKTRASRSYPRS